MISTGGLLVQAIAIADQLLDRGVTTRVLSMHTLKPLDTEAVLTAARETQALATIEEHSIIGGLGSAVAEILAESQERHGPFKRIGLDSAFATVAGDQEYLRKTFGLSIDNLTERLMKLTGSPNQA